jgi:hypothetical protein
MKVKDCQGCRHKQRRTWSQYVKPNNFHAIGFTHAYAYCTKHQKRVRDVKKCNVKEVTP